MKTKYALFFPKTESTTPKSNSRQSIAIKSKVKASNIENKYHNSLNMTTYNKRNSSSLKHSNLLQYPNPKPLISKTLNIQKLLKGVPKTETVSPKNSSKDNFQTIKTNFSIDGKRNSQRKGSNHPCVNYSYLGRQRINTPKMKVKKQNCSLTSQNSVNCTLNKGGDHSEGFLLKVILNRQLNS